MAKTTLEITEAATKIRSNIIDAVFDKCWTEFIRNCDELDWSRSKIVGDDTKNNMLAAVRAGIAPAAVELGKEALPTLSR